jgi:hypothetical protein
LSRSQYPGPRVELRITFPDQTPDLYAECHGYQVAPIQAWTQANMTEAQKMVDAGTDPNRIGLFVVPGVAS